MFVNYYYTHVSNILVGMCVLSISIIFDFDHVGYLKIYENRVNQSFNNIQLL